MIVNNIIVIVFFLSVYGEIIKSSMRERNVLLRKRRYLDFPEGSNLLLTLSLVKAIMVRKPKGYNSLVECDIPFPLPPVTENLKNKKNRFGRSKDLHSKWSSVFNRLGLNGEKCIEKMLCEAKYFVQTRRGSLISNILQALLGYDIEERVCNEEESYNCQLPYLPDVLMKLLKLETFNF